MVAARLGGGSEMGNQEGRRRSRWSGCVVIYGGQATGDRRATSKHLSQQQERGQLGAIGTTLEVREHHPEIPLSPHLSPIHPSPIHPLSSTSILIPSSIPHSHQEIRAGEKGEDGPSRRHGTPNTEPAYVPFGRGTIERTEKPAGLSRLSPALPRTKRRLS